MAVGSHGHRARLVLVALVAWSGLATASPLGWRTDGTGSYPDATPPLRWSTTENVTWKTPLPSWGNATPVVVGDRVFVTAEPSVLLACSTKDGRILWQHKVSRIDALPVKDQPAARKRLERALVVQREMEAKQAELDKVRRLARKKSGGASLTAQVEKLGRELGTLRAEFDQSADIRDPHDVQTVGNATATPLTDGTSVFSVFGNDVVAAHTLDGKLRWARHLPRPFRDMHGYFDGQAASPLLAGGVLVVALGYFYGLDPATGATKWTNETRYLDYGTPGVVESTGKSLVFVPDGRLLDARDGREVQRLPHALWYLGPLVTPGVAYYLGSLGDQDLQARGHADAAAVKLSDGFGTLWTAKLPKDRYYASPVLHDGRLFTTTAFGKLVVLDAKTGAEQHQRDLGLFGGHVYPSLSVAGGYVFTSIEGGTTVVLEGRPPFTEVARNVLEPFRASPVFVGKRLYLRGESHLYAIDAP